MTGGETGDVQVGHEFTDVGEVDYALFFNGCGSKCANRYRNIVNTLFAFRGGHDDLFEYGCFLFFLRNRGIPRESAGQ